MKTGESQTISIPIHPDDYDVPVSVVHLQLSKNPPRYATIVGPLAYKTLAALQGTLIACRDTLVTQPKAEQADFEI